MEKIFDLDSIVPTDLCYALLIGWIYAGAVIKISSSHA